MPPAADSPVLSPQWAACKYHCLKKKKRERQAELNLLLGGTGLPGCLDISQYVAVMEGTVGLGSTPAREQNLGHLQVMAEGFVILNQGLQELEASR